MAKRTKTPTNDPGEICNPVKAAALMTCLPTPHVPVDIKYGSDGVLRTFFLACPRFLADSKVYDRRTLPCDIKRFVKVRSRLSDMRAYANPDVSELVRLIQN